MVNSTKILSTAWEDSLSQMAQPLQVNSSRMTSMDLLLSNGPMAQSTKVNGEMDMRKAKVPESMPMEICGLDCGRMEREMVTVSSLNV